jgi:alpha/beta hydrolase fold
VDESATGSANFWSESVSHSPRVAWSRSAPPTAGRSRTAAKAPARCSSATQAAPDSRRGTSETWPDWDFTLILLNPRGSEGSDRPTDPREYETADYVSDLDELRAHLGLERMPLLGHSHGGVVAAAYAAAYPDRIDRLVLASTLARFAQEQHAAMEAGVKAKEGKPW